MIRKYPRIRLAAAAIVAAVIAVGCGTGGEQSGAEQAADEADHEQGGATEPREVSVEGSDGLVWGDGDYGVVMVPGAAYDAEDWGPQAERIAGNDMVALGIDDTSTVVDAVEYMESELGVQDVAIMGGSVGADAALEAAADDQELADQLILLSPNSEVSGLGDCPKLFVASEEESLADTTEQMADEAPGHDNESLILPGDAHAQAIFETEEGDRVEQEILDRLQERS